MRLHKYSFCFLLFFFLIFSNYSRLDAEDHINVNSRITNQDVEEAIDSFKTMLIHSVKTNGVIEFSAGGSIYDVGTTAICGYALVVAGVDKNSAIIERMLVYCSKNITKAPTTYNLACCALFFAEVNPLKFNDDLIYCRDKLVVSQNSPGMWAYEASGRDGRGVQEYGDNSNTQFAILGLWACARAGLEVPVATWKRARAHFVNSQNSDSGWGYARWGGRDSSYDTMTAAAIASLWIINEQLDGKHLHCDSRKNYEEIEAGIKWLDKNFHPSGGISSWNNYFLYAVERAGIITARRYFNDYDWYRAGATTIVNRKHRATTIPEVAFGLLFLAKGRTPLIVQKLERDDRDWDNDHYDLENLTNYYTQQTGNKVTWQNARMRVNAGDLLEAPVLLMSGRKELLIDIEQRRILKEYLFNGGTILGIPAGESQSWDSSFRSLIKDLLPTSTFMKLDIMHPIYSHMFSIPVDQRPEAYGVFQGCSLKVLLIPKGSLTCKWTTEDYSDKSFRMGVNLLGFLAGDEGLKNRIDPVKFAPLINADDATTEDIPRGAVVIGQVKHDGLWRPQQFDIYNLMKHLNEKSGITASFKPEAVSLESEKMYNYPILFMTGQFKFSYTKQQAENLRKFIERGGFLFAEPCCGQKAFDEGFRKFIADVFPEKSLKPIPFDNEIYTIGYDIRKVKYRIAVRKVKPDLSKPVLEGISVGERYGVVYTPYNFSIGLNGHPCPICWGYSQEDSLKVASNIVLYALNN